MRALFTSMVGLGHLHPLLPVARALAAAGHEVRFAVPASLVPAVAHAGFRAVAAGLDGEAADHLPQLRALPAAERGACIQREVFAGLRPRRLVPELLALAADWQPDLIVREEREYGGCLAAEALGLPHAAVSISAAGDVVPPGRLAAPLAGLRAAFGLPPDPGMAMPHRYLTLRPFPPRFQDPALPVAPATRYLRPTPDDRTGPEGLPPWVAARPARPVAYVGLGTVHNRPEIFRAILAGLRDEALTLVATVGRDQDPADYGPQPENVHIERYVPLSLLLPHCDMAVTNGGSGTLMAALAHGLPLVVVPVGADQPQNAARCAALGLGVVVAPAALTPEAARRAALAALADPAYRQAAGHLRGEMAALPGPEHAVSLLERLARDRRPLPGA
jgi:UDP:flavonoid glycosyltransferase YjiC (YdhE family)